MERPNPDDEPRPDSGPDERKPRDPKPQNPKVTPLDEDKHIEDGIVIKET
jgi:hypothetical protein